MMTSATACHQLKHFALAILIVSLSAYSYGYSEKTEKETPRYKPQVSFSWSNCDTCNHEPRGGTTKGTGVQLDATPHPGWLSLQDENIDKFEKDRRAILAMAGPYRTSFDFLEVVGYTPSFSPSRPYQSWGTEYVYVVEDKRDFISLQHIMVMFFEDEDGSVHGPMVMKHWRQDWRYQKSKLLTYAGHGTWEKTKLSRKKRRGSWAQAVYQVDDSPRYESYGKWEHRNGFSTWTSAPTWRPLPRREYSVREDYQVLEGINRHTITPDGWIHEQENYKVVIDKETSTKIKPRYLSKEIGLNRYERIVGHDFSAGDIYWENTGQYWGEVRDFWRQHIAKKKHITLQKKVDGIPMFVPLFEYASDIDNGNYDANDAKQFIQKTIEAYIVSHRPKQK